MKACSWGVVIMVAALAGLGCDDAPTVPEELIAPEQPAPSVDEPPPPPATQELINGKYKTLSLPSMPLTISVPESWAIEDFDSGAIQLIKGYVPNGEVQINLSHRPPTTKEKIDVVLDGAKREMASDPTHIRKVDFYDRGQMKILERQIVWTAASPNPNAAPGDEMLPLMRWTITTYVPAGDGFNSYELNFITLTEKQFNADQAFLRKIVDSLAYDSSKPMTPAPVESTPPAAK